MTCNTLALTNTESIKFAPPFLLASLLTQRRFLERICSGHLMLPTDTPRASVCRRSKNFGQ